MSFVGIANHICRIKMQVSVLMVSFDNLTKFYKSSDLDMHCKIIALKMQLNSLRNTCFGVCFLQELQTEGLQRHFNSCSSDF